MEIESKMFDLFKDKAMSVLSSQLALLATYLTIFVVAMIGAYEKDYFNELSAIILFAGIAFFLFFDLKYREYRRNYINIIVLCSIREINKEATKKELMTILSRRLLIDEEDIEISIDDLVERGLLTMAN